LDSILAQKIIAGFHDELMRTIKQKSNNQFFEEFIKKNSSPDKFILRYLMTRAEDYITNDELGQLLYPHYRLVRDFYLQIAQEKSRVLSVSLENQDNDFINVADLLGTITLNEEEVSTCHLNNQQVSFLANYSYLRLFEDFLSPVDNLRDLSEKRFRSGAFLILIYHNIAPIVYTNLYSIQHRLSPIINPSGLNEDERNIFKLILLFPAIETKALLAKDEILKGFKQGKIRDFTSITDSGELSIIDTMGANLRSVIVSNFSKFTDKIKIEEEFLFNPDEVKSIKDELINMDYIKMVWPQTLDE